MTLLNVAPWRIKVRSPQTQQNSSAQNGNVPFLNETVFCCWFHFAAFGCWLLLVSWAALLRLSEQMRSSHADRRGFPVFVWWENVHFDALWSALPTSGARTRTLRLESRRPQASAWPRLERADSRLFVEPLVPLWLLKHVSGGDSQRWK